MDTVSKQDGNNQGMEPHNKFVSNVKNKLLIRTCLPLVLLVPVPCILLYVTYTYRRIGAVPEIAHLLFVWMLLLAELCILYLLYKKYSLITREKIYHLIDSEPLSESRFSSIVELEQILKEKASPEHEAIKSYILVQAEKSLVKLDPGKISWPSRMPLFVSILVLAFILWSAFHTFERAAQVREQYSRENAEMISRLEEVLLTDVSLSKEIKEAGRDLIDTLQHQSLDSKEVGESLRNVEDSIRKERESPESEKTEQESENESSKDHDSGEDQKKEQEDRRSQENKSDDETRDQGKEEKKTEYPKEEKKPDKDGLEDKEKPHDQKSERDDSTEESKEPTGKKEEKEGGDTDAEDKTTPEEPASDSDKKSDQTLSESGVEKKEQDTSDGDSGEKQDMGEGAEGEGDGDDSPGASQGGDGISSDISDDSSGSETATDEQGKPDSSSGESTATENEGDIQGDDSSLEKESDPASKEGEDRQESTEAKQKLEDIISEMKEKRGEKGDDGTARDSGHETQTESGQESESDGSEKKESDSTSDSEKEGATADQDGDSDESEKDSGGTRAASQNEQGFPQSPDSPENAPSSENLPNQEELSNEEMEEFGDIESMDLPDGEKDPLSLDGYDFEEVKIESDRISDGAEGVVLDSVEQESTSASSTMQIESTQFKKPQLGKTSEEQPVPLEYEKLLR